MAVVENRVGVLGEDEMEEAARKDFQEEPGMMERCFQPNVTFFTVSNIARIANAVHCHSCLSGNKDCHDFRFIIVRIVISVSNATSL